MSYHNEEKYIEKINEQRSKMIQSIAENMDLYGITDSIGRLYGILHFSNHPLNLDEMREALGMSKTSMSNGVRTLLETKMVKKVWKKGERKDLYITENDWYKNFVDYFSTKWLDAIELNMKVIGESETVYRDLLNEIGINDTIKEEIKTDLNKIENMKNYYKWLKNLIDAFETGKIFEIVPKPNNN